MEVDDDVEDDDMDFNPFLLEGSPSETSSSLTSDAECEETSFENQPSTEEHLRHNPDNENKGYRALRISAKGGCEENVPESTSTRLYCENGEGHVNGLRKEPFQTEASFSPSVQNSHPLLLEASEEDAICRRTRARYSLANYALEELETFLQESDDDGDLHVDEEEEYRKFLAAVLSGGGDDTQVCQGDETQDEDENDADFVLELEEALESDGDDNVENSESINDTNKKDGNRPQTRKKRPELSRAVKDSTKSNLRPILPNISSALLAPLNASGWRYPSQNISVPSSSSSVTGAAVVNGFTDEQLVELVGCRDQALARRTPLRQRQFYFERQHLQSALTHGSSESSKCQWIPLIRNPIISILDVSPLHPALSYLSDVAAALGLLEYNNDWGAIQKRFLPCKSKHQIFVRQKNRSSAKAPDNPIKDVRRMKTSPLSTEEIQRIDEGLKIFRTDWKSIWKFLLPYRDRTLLPRQWRVATGVQRTYTKSDALREKRRSYEAQRRKLKASVPDSQVVREQEADDGDASEGVENDDDSYVNEAFLADTENRSINRMQRGTSAADEFGPGHGCFEQHNRNSMKHGMSTSTPLSSYASDGPSTKRVFRGTLDELQASQMGKGKGSRVVKLAPDLPAINLPSSVRVISQMEFHQNAAHFNGTSDNAAKVLPPTINLFHDHSATHRLRQHGIINGSVTEDGAEQDFPMHPLLFQHPREVHSSYSHHVEIHNTHPRSYDLFPFEKVQVEKSNTQTTHCMEGAPVNANTINFHPLLQRTEGEMHGEAPEEGCRQFANQADCPIREPSTSAWERENNIDLGIHLCSSIQPEGYMIASISNLEPVYAFHRDVEEPSEEAMQGIVMEQEELTDSEEDIQHVEFECEEMDDSEEEQVQDAEPRSTKKNKRASASAVGLEQVVKRRVRSKKKSHGSSNASSGRAKLKPVRGKRLGSRTGQRLSISQTSEPSPARSRSRTRTRTRTRKSKGRQEGAGVEHKSSDSRSSIKSPAPS